MTPSTRPRLYLVDGVAVYVREDRGPYRLLHIEAGRRVADAAFKENSRRRGEDRQLAITERVSP